jgi:hypothetical protein
MPQHAHHPSLDWMMIALSRSQYAGLYEEARGDPNASQAYVEKAISTAYAHQADGLDYMVALARVHSLLRRDTSDGQVAKAKETPHFNFHSNCEHH